MDAPGKEKDLAYWQAGFKKLMTDWGMSDGCFRRLPEIIPGLPRMSEVDKLNHLVQAERDVRRLGLHRVEEALAAGLPVEQLNEYVAFLIAESKRRQDDIEKKADGIVLPALERIIRDDLDERKRALSAEIQRLKRSVGLPT